MSELNKENISRKIFDLCQEYYKYEKTINYKNHINTNGKGYLIDEELMDKFKKKYII